MSTIPDIIKQFTDQQDAVPFSPDDHEFPYSGYWWKAVAYILLSGRVKPKSYSASPNMTDVNRVCKEANFDQYFFRRASEFLTAAGVVKNGHDYYEKDKNFGVFLGNDIAAIRSVARNGVLKLIEKENACRSWRPRLVWNAGLIEFLILFFTVFEGYALRYDKIGSIFINFSKWPETSLQALASRSGIDEREISFFNWENRLDKKGQAALLSALFSAGWAYTFLQNKTDWIYLNNTGRVMLGLENTLSKPPEILEFKALPNLCVFAGADLPAEKLITLFRYSRIRRIDRVFEFQLDKKAMNEMPSGTSAGEELKKALQDLEPLPQTIKNLLEDKSETGGILHISSCSAVVKSEDPAMLDVIRKHGKLKGYIKPGGPPGYLLIKSGSDLYNFIKRCREFGFETKGG